MRLHTHTMLPSFMLRNFTRNFAIGLISLASAYTHASLVNPANAQSFPNDSLPVSPTVSTSSQYLVYLPNVTSIQQAKAIAPDAFVSRLDSGEQVVQLGRFNNLNLAQRRASQFSQAGLSPQIVTVQSKFTSAPVAPAPSVSTLPPASSFPSSSVPIPVDAIPIQTSRESLPGVPGYDFPTNNSNSIEIVRSPQALPPSSQPLPIQAAPQSFPPVAAAQPNNVGSQLRYFVIIPTSSVAELQRVQTISPNAQIRSSYRGTYIEIQGYPDRTSAEALNLTVRRQGFDSRVVFF